MLDPLPRLLSCFMNYTRFAKSFKSAVIFPFRRFTLSWVGLHSFYVIINLSGSTDAWCSEKRTFRRSIQERQVANFCTFNKWIRCFLIPPLAVTCDGCGVFIFQSDGEILTRQTSRNTGPAVTYLDSNSSVAFYVCLWFVPAEAVRLTRTVSNYKWALSEHEWTSLPR
jgi:hypothetical protein